MYCLAWSDGSKPSRSMRNENNKLNYYKHDKDDTYNNKVNLNKKQRPSTPVQKIHEFTETTIKNTSVAPAPIKSFNNDNTSNPPDLFEYMPHTDYNAMFRPCGYREEVYTKISEREPIEQVSQNPFFNQANYLNHLNDEHHFLRPTNNYK